MATQEGKGKAFRALHEREGAFIIPNPYDAGTAKILAALGFEAIATTSSGFAFTIGKRDNAVGRDAMIDHVGRMATAVDIPVSADLENGYGDEPETAAETIRLAAEAGAVGGSIEDSKRDGEPIYDIALATERVRAAVEAAQSLPFTFTLTARAENFIVGRPDLADTIKRLQAYQEAGADVLFAPGVVKKDDISAVVSSVDRPVNVLMGMRGGLSVGTLSELGVKRVSVGGALSRMALGAFLRAARELREQGTFGFLDEAASMREVSDFFDE